jgi:hypothetical protein
MIRRRILIAAALILCTGTSFASEDGFIRLRNWGYDIDRQIERYWGDCGRNATGEDCMKKCRELMKQRELFIAAASKYKPFDNSIGPKSWKQHYIACIRNIRQLEITCGGGASCTESYPRELGRGCVQASKQLAAELEKLQELAPLGALDPKARPSLDPNEPFMQIGPPG